MTFDPTRPVQTRDGRPARIVCTDAIGPAPILALVHQFEGFTARPDGLEVACFYRPDGGYALANGTACDTDLVNVPVQRERWVNFYRHLAVPDLIEPDKVLFRSKAEADRAAESYAREYPRVACVRVTWEE